MVARADALEALAVGSSPGAAERLAVVNAPGVIGAAGTVGRTVAAWCDDWREAGLLPAAVRDDGLDGLARVLTGADLVWLGLPGSVAGLDEFAGLAAAHASPGARLVVTGRHADLSRAMNEVLARYFERVWASLGVGKLRALVAEAPLPSARSLGTRPVWPKTGHVPALGLDVVAHGTTFALTRLDPGTKALVAHLEDVPRGDVLDAGSGSGILAALLARREGQPPGRVSAVDVLATNVDATARTARAAGVDVRAFWGDGLTDVPDDSLDAIVTNPPFHRGVAKDSSASLALFADAARVLRPGGQLWAVYNSHLPWKARLTTLVGPTRLVAQDPRYTVVCATRR